ESKAKVALVDLDLQFGDIGVLLNLDHSQGITDLIENIDHMDPDFIREIMVDGPYGIKVLLTPISPELADLVTVDHVRRIFSELRKMFDYIIVDSSAHLGESGGAHGPGVVERPAGPGAAGQAAAPGGSRRAGDGRKNPPQGSVRPPLGRLR